MAKAKAPAKAAKKTAGRGGAKKTARKAADRARGAGAIGPWGSASKRALRDIAIVATIAAGATQQEAASEFGVTVRTVREILKRREDRPSLLDAKPMEILEGFVRETRDTIERLQAAGLRAIATENLPVLVGAAKAELLARRELMELMIAVGVMPESLELFRSEAMLRRMADEMRETMQRVESGELSVEESVAFWRALAAPGERPQIEAAT